MKFKSKVDFSEIKEISQKDREVRNQTVLKQVIKVCVACYRQGRRRGIVFILFQLTGL